MKTTLLTISTTDEMLKDLKGSVGTKAASAPKNGLMKKRNRNFEVVMSGVEARKKKDRCAFKLDKKQK